MIDWDEIEKAPPRVVDLPPKEPYRSFGLITIILLVVFAVVAFVAGNALQIATSPNGGIPLGLEQWQQDGVASLVYAGGALLISLIFALLGRWSRYAPWRGIGRAFGAAAFYVIVTGGYLALYHYPFGIHIPNWPYAIFNLIVVFIMWRVMSRWLNEIPEDANVDLSKSRSSLGFTLLLGLLMTMPFASVGSLGDMGELITAIAEAAALAGICTIMLVLPLRFEPTFGQTKPGLAIFYSGFVLFGLAPAFMMGRGLLVQNFMLGNLLAGGAFLAALVLNLSPMPDVRRSWGNAYLFLFAALLTPLVLSDGVEMDFMLDTAVYWLQIMLFCAVGAIIAFLILIFLRLRLVSLFRWRGLGWVLGLVMFGGVGALYTLVWGGPLLQPTTFFVTLNDQVDTSFALEIEDRDERVAAVYDNLTDHATRSQNRIRRIIEVGGGQYTPFYLINGLEVRTYNPLLRLQLTNNSEVSHVLRAPQARIYRFQQADLDGFLVTPVDPPADVTWGLRELDVPQVWRDLGIEGDGIVVGVADSGTDWEHEALSENYRGREGNHDYNWFDPMLGEEAPLDSNGHGTHTAGTSVGRKGIGIAPDAEWIACRNLPFNLGNPSDYLACMEFLFAPFPIGGDSFADGDATLGAHVTNNSWGCPFQEGCDGETLGLATLQLRNAGQMMVVSAGNSGPACHTIGIPANNDDVFSVGALTPAGTIASFSSRGPAIDYDDDVIIKPDIIAPGVDIISALPGGGYVSNQGTSMAGPHVAGVVALLWSANPDLIGDIDATEEIIRATAVPTEIPLNGDTSPCGPSSQNDVAANNTFGFGVVNALAAVEMALSYEK